jgi:hypothetical protein
MAGMLRTEARKHGVSIRTNLKDDLPMTVADRVQLQQVLMNLMLNGIEAMKDTGGVLTVNSQLGEDGQIEISVNDTGPGLPPGKADQIFDAFLSAASGRFSFSVCPSYRPIRVDRCAATDLSFLPSFTPAEPSQGPLSPQSFGYRRDPISSRPWQTPVRWRARGSDSLR